LLVFTNSSRSSGFTVTTCSSQRHARLKSIDLPVFRLRLASRRARRKLTENNTVRDKNNTPRTCSFIIITEPGFRTR
jgi:hypothetical protein